MKDKFQSMVDNYYNGNLSLFRNDLNKLSKKNLILFLQYCNEYMFVIDIWVVEKYLNG